jgi:hypothetical protein
MILYLLGMFIHYLVYGTLLTRLNNFSLGFGSIGMVSRRDVAVKLQSHSKLEKREERERNEKAKINDRLVGG